MAKLRLWTMKQKVIKLLGCSVCKCVHIHVCGFVSQSVDVIGHYMVR